MRSPDQPSKSTLRLALLASAIVVTGCGADPTPTKFTTGGADIPAEPGKTNAWKFDDAKPGAVPPDFIGVLGDWQVSADGSAPSGPNLFRQAGSFESPDFPRIIVKDLTFTDLTVRVRCRPESGDEDQACGLMFRLEDSENYYVTRANALEDNVRLYHVVDGDREEFASADITVKPDAWHTLEATAHGRSFTVSWDGKKVIDASDSTFARGKIGLWTKADSVTAFDDLEATAE